MKKKIITVIILSVICGSVFGGIYLYNKSVDEAYNNAITLIENGAYENALSKFESANPDLLDRDDFKWDVKHKKLDKCYKNTVPLYTYALAQLEYNSENRSMRAANDYLQLIPDDYAGEMSEEIKTFKGNFKPQYDEYLAEQAREAERQEQ